MMSLIITLSALLFAGLSDGFQIHHLPMQHQASSALSTHSRRSSLSLWQSSGRINSDAFQIHHVSMKPHSLVLDLRSRASLTSLWQSSPAKTAGINTKTGAGANVNSDSLRCPMSDPSFQQHAFIDDNGNSPSSTAQKQQSDLHPPSFLSALFGIAIAGSPWDYMLALRAKGYDGVVPINLGPLGVYNFLLSPSSVRSATVEHATTLPRRFSVPLFETLELDRGLVYEQGDRHKRHKRLCIPSFEQSQSMDAFVVATRDELDAVGERFDIVSSSDQMLDLYAEMRKATLNVVLAVTFGLGRTGADNFDRAAELSQTIGGYLEKIVALANEIPPLWQISPRLSSNYVQVTDTLLPNLRELVAEVIAARRQLEQANSDDEAAAATVGRADLLSVLVEQPDLTDADIRSILFDVVIAGSDTTASTSTAAMYVLHEPQNAEWLKRAREEAIAKNAGNGVELADIRSELPIITAVAREILRLYPPVPFVGRTATEDGTLCHRLYPVKTGDTFCFSPWYLGRDPEAWFIGSDILLQSSEAKVEGANSFYPQRWLDDSMNGGAPTSFSWLPFGAGPRGCLGTRLGLTEVILSISRLLCDYEFTFEQKGPLPVKYDLTLNLEGVTNCKLSQRQ